MSVLDKYFDNCTPLELENISIYGVKHPIELAPDDDNLQEGQCVCGAFDCDEEYAHWTSGY